MLLKKYKFDWYKNFNIKVFDSKSDYEGYGGVEFHNSEYCFYFDLYSGSYEGQRHIVNVNIPYILQIFEKVYLLNNGVIPDVFRFMSFDGIVNKIIIQDIIFDITKRFSESVLDAQIILIINKAKEEKRSIIFQSRIPWELSSNDDGSYSVYGRFATGII